MSYNTFSAICNGNVYPSRFVKLSTAVDNGVEQAAANDEVTGVSSDATRDAPIPNATAYAGTAGDQLNVNPIGTVALVQVAPAGGGFTAVARGDRLISDANGCALTAASTGTTVQWVGGRALASALPGELVPVLVHPYPWRPALS